MTMRNVMLLAMILGACGGGKSSSTTTTPDEQDQTPIATDNNAADMVSMETADEIKTLLERKRNIVSRCLAVAVDNKELPKNSRGKITLTIDIEPSGKAGNIKVEKATIESKSLTDCVLGHVREIQFPHVPKTYPYTYSYGFEAM
jgi:hypothetical protein